MENKSGVGGGLKYGRKRNGGTVAGGGGERRARGMSGKGPFQSVEGATPWRDE